MCQSNYLVGLLAALLAISLAAPGIAVGVADGDTGGSEGKAVAADTSTDVTMVSDCREITSPGHYRLAEDLLDLSVDRCIVIKASDVIFDGNGHRIDGVNKYLYTTETGEQDRTKGVIAKQGPHTNVRVRNLTVTEFGYGLWYGDTREGRVVNNTFRDNGVYGVYLGYEANNNTVADNRIINTTSPGLDINGQAIVVAHVANRNDIVDNYVRKSEQNGIAVHLGNHTRIVNNTIIDSGTHGIKGGQEGTVIVDNVVRRSGVVGIFGEGEESEVVDNVVAGSGRAGIQFARADGTRIEGNEVRNSTHGIHFGESDDAVISGNLVAENDLHGLTLHGESGDIHVSENTFEGNVEWDIISERHAGPITVEDATLGGDTAVSYEGRQIAVVGTSSPPDPLPDGTRAVSGFVTVWSPAEDDSWLDLMLSYDASSVDDEGSIGLWIHRGTWSQVPSSDVERDTPDLSTNVTDIGRTIHLVAAADSGEPSEDDTGATDSPDDEEPAEGDPADGETAAGESRDSDQEDGEDGGDTGDEGGAGFGIEIAVVAVLLKSLLVLIYRN